MREDDGIGKGFAQGNRGWRHLLVNGKLGFHNFCRGCSSEATCSAANFEIRLRCVGDLIARDKPRQVFHARINFNRDPVFGARGPTGGIGDLAEIDGDGLAGDADDLRRDRQIRPY